MILGMPTLVSSKRRGRLPPQARVLARRRSRAAHGGTGRRGHTLGGNGALRQFRDRGGDVGPKAGAGPHRPVEILKFEGGYHGHDDALLVEAGSGVASHGIATSAGVHPEYAASTLVAPYNDLDAVRSLFAVNRGEIAAVIVEPWPGTWAWSNPSLGFSKGYVN